MRKLFLPIALALVFTSCSTIFTGTSTPITFKSNVPAKVEFDGVEMGQTPYTTKVKRSYNGVVTMRSDGYESKNFELQKSFSAISILNLLRNFWRPTKESFVAHRLRNTGLNGLV